MKLTKSQLSLLIRQLIREASPEARATFADDDGPDLGYSAEDEKTKAEKKRKGLSTKIGNSLVPGAKIEIINIRGGKDPEEEAPFMSSQVRDEGDVVTTLAKGLTLKSASEGAAGRLEAEAGESKFLFSIIEKIGGPKGIKAVFDADFRKISSLLKKRGRVADGRIDDFESAFKEIVTDNQIDASLSFESVRAKISDGVVKSLTIALSEGAFSDAAYAPSNAILAFSFTMGESKETPDEYGLRTKRIEKSVLPDAPIIVSIRVYENAEGVAKHLVELVMSSWYAVKIGDKIFSLR